MHDDYNGYIANIMKGKDFPEFCSKKGIKLAILFGSRAKGKAFPESDWDIAVLLDKKYMPKTNLEVGRLKRKLVRDLSLLTNSSQIDIIMLNYASAFMKFHIARTGKVIYQKAKEDFAEFASLALRQHEDAALFFELDKKYLNR